MPKRHISVIKVVEELLSQREIHLSVEEQHTLSLFDTIAKRSLENREKVGFVPGPGEKKMAQSAWNTQFFDGRVFPKKPGHSAEIAAGATPPAMYTQPAALTDRGRMLGLASITLRTATLLFSIVAITMMSLDTEARRVSAFSFISVKFTDLSAYIFLISMNAIVCAYSMAQLLHTILLLMSGKAFPQPVLSLGVLTYTCDQVLSFSLMAASAAGAAAAVILRKGELGLSCSSYNILQFCAKSEAAVATSFISFMFIAVCNSFSAYRLFQQLNVP